MADAANNIHIMNTDPEVQTDDSFQPNKETIAAMLEAERIAKDPSVKHYTDLDELFADLRS